MNKFQQYDRAQAAYHVGMSQLDSRRSNCLPVSRCFMHACEILVPTLCARCGQCHTWSSIHGATCVKCTFAPPVCMSQIRKHSPIAKRSADECSATAFLIAGTSLTKHARSAGFVSACCYCSSCIRNRTCILLLQLCMDNRACFLLLQLCIDNRVRIVVLQLCTDTEPCTSVCEVERP